MTLTPRMSWAFLLLSYLVAAPFAVAQTCPRIAELPIKESTHSYWHTEPSKRLYGHRSTEKLPEAAEVVVIGSGISGAFAARELANGGKSVLMLEAREACWGATGRNGGHCKPGIYSNKAHLARFELDTYNFIKNYIAENNVQCDWNATGGVASFPFQDQVDKAAKNIAELRKNDSALADKVKLFTKPEDLARLRLTNMLGAVVQDDAAKLWPYKLVAHVLEDLLDRGACSFNLQTNTPVTRLQRMRNSWLVHTPRGKVMAKSVLLATNAYTSHLLPDFQNLIVPNRGQVAAVEVPKDSIPLSNTYVWFVDDGDSDVYLIQRDVSNTIILGGLRLSVPGGEKCISRDNVINHEIADELHEASSHALKLRPKGEPEQKVLPSSMDWTGIMGFSADSHPWVGAVPEELGGGEGLYIAAGYTGHGMPTAARSAIAAAQQILKTSGVQLPPEYVLSMDRAKQFL